MSSPNKKSEPDDSSNDPTRLTSLLPSGRGGLQPRKARYNGNDAATDDNKPAGASLLGLDRLAAVKRQEQGQQRKNYRRQYDETPSHPGGVNRQVQTRVRDRHARGAGRDNEDPRAAFRRKRDYHHDDDDDNNERGGSRQRRRHDSDDEQDDRRRRDDHHSSRGRRDDRYSRSRHEEGDRRRGKRDDSNPRKDDRGDRYSERRPRDSERRYRDSERRPRHDSQRRPRDSEFRQRDSERRPRDTREADFRRGDGSSAINNSMPPPPSRGMTSTRRPPQGGGGLLERPTPGRPPASSWDTVTPAPRARDETDDALKNGNPSDDGPADDDSFDRQFYLQEDEGHYVQDAQDGEDLGRFLYDSAKIKDREKEMEQKRQSRVNLRQAARQDDQDAWEQNRLRVSGATAQGEVSLDISTEQDTRVTLLVHQVKPPFLDGRVSFSKIREAVPTVKDASSDFAKMAREGSETLRMLRAKKEKNAMRQKFWELGGTRMGEAVGIKKEVKKEEGSTAAETADGEIDYKKSSGFADHVKSKKGDAVSKFAKEKSIRQQREYLPVFTVREQLLSVIRENNVTVIVGETGSGKVSFILIAIADQLNVFVVFLVSHLPTN